MTPESAIEIIKSNIRQNREDDLVLIDERNVNRDDIPVVHPMMENISFYKGGAALDEDGFRASSLNRFGIANIRFEQLHRQRHRYKRIAVIGYPGSGKTTCSKRLARSNNLFCLHLKFMDLNYREKLTLQDLLINNQFQNESIEVCNLAFQWIRENQSQCVIILDGYDQVNWSINSVPAKSRLESQLEVSDIIGNLFRRHFLPDSLVIFTSRPHSMLSLPQTLRPEMTVHLWDFAFDDMKRLFLGYAGAADGENTWNRLEQSAPQLVAICHNPLMLQYTVMACRNPLQDVGEIITITRVFTSVLGNLAHSEYARAEKNIFDIRKQLSKIAYKATFDGTVLIKVEDLRSQGLDIKEVQDLIIATPGYKGHGSRIFEGETKVYFTHQCTQEYLTAWYIKYHMEVKEFDLFCRSHLLQDKWSTVRRFLCGLLVDDYATTQQGVSRAHLAEKRSTLVKVLTETMSEDTDIQAADYLQIVHPVVRGRFTKFKSQCGDIRECNNDDVTRAAAENFPAQLIFTGIRFTSSEAFALGYVLKKVEKNIQILDMQTCELSTEQLLHISSGIKEMTGSIDVLTIIGNAFTGDIAVGVICEILPWIKKKLKMWDAFINDDQEPEDLNEEQIARIQSALNALPSSGLIIYVTRERTLRKI